MLKVDKLSQVTYDKLLRHEDAGLGICLTLDKHQLVFKFDYVNGYMWMVDIHCRNGKVIHHIESRTMRGLKQAILKLQKNGFK